MLRFPILLFLCYIGFFFCGCSSQSRSEENSTEEQEFIKMMGEKPSVKVIKRLGTPSGHLEAVICELQTNATVATPTEIYILQAGNDVTGHPVFRADKLTALDVRWEGQQPTIRATEGRVFLGEEEIGVLTASGKIKVPIAIEITKPAKGTGTNSTPSWLSPRRRGFFFGLNVK